jgi:hypothetical protein
MLSAHLCTGSTPEKSNGKPYAVREGLSADRLWEGLLSTIVGNQLAALVIRRRSHDHHAVAV